MRTVDEKPMETLHLYIVPEDKLPPKPDYLGKCIATVCSLILVAMIGLILFSPKTEPVISFTTTIAGFHLPSVSKTVKLPIFATGKGHVNATYATGEITFYNGQTYTQVIPVGMILKGSDGVAITTDAQAVIPPAAETFPPTYGRVNVSAHALNPGISGNMQAGDINEPCCVTSVIAQNPYNFSGGINARDFTFLTSQDVSYAVTDRIQGLEQEAITLFPSHIVLEPQCKSTTLVNPSIGSETKNAVLTLIIACNAISYSSALVKNRIVEIGKRYGEISDIQFSIVGITQKKGVVFLRLYVTATVVPIVHTRFGGR